MQTPYIVIKININNATKSCTEPKSIVIFLKEYSFWTLPDCWITKIVKFFNGLIKDESLNLMKFIFMFAVSMRCVKLMVAIDYLINDFIVNC